MVWGLFSVNPLPGVNGYYISQKGAYQVGRKVCDIVIDDKGVSRLHAEIIVDEMLCVDQLQHSHSSNSSKARLKDCSKYGTFVTRDTGSKVKVQECPNKELELVDGDVVSFGTGNARYKFSFVPLVFFASPSKPMNVNVLREKISSIGASFTQSLTSKYTHIICDDLIPLNDEILDAIFARKPVVKSSWVELIAEKTVSSDMPSSILHAPNLIFEGVTSKIAEPQSRGECLKGYTFILESVKKYKFKEKFPLLLELAGAKVVYAETQQNSNHSSGGNIVFVIPAIAESYNRLTSFPKVTETQLILAVVSGSLDHSLISSTPELVTSSDSTDGTVVADSDLEMETATSNHAAKEVISVESPEVECRIKVEEDENRTVRKVFHIIESTDQDSEEKNEAAVKTDFHDRTSDTSMRASDEGGVVVKDICPESETSSIDVIFSKNLIVREPVLLHKSVTENGACTNFKQFRKMNTPSGNSFSNLIPFSKDPYQEIDSESRDVSEYCREEKKRKQTEAMAEALFNDDKGRRRAASGSGSVLRFLGHG